MLKYFYLFLLPVLVYSQKSKPYLGQPLPGNIPVVFAPGIISKPPLGAYSITISRTGNEIFFSRFDGNKNTTWFTELIDTTWITPTIADFGLDGYNTEASFTPYSDTILYVSDRKDPNDTLTIRKRIWYVTRTPVGWSTPKIFPIPPSVKDRYSPSMACNGNIYFSEYSSTNDWSIYKSELVNNVYQTPIKLGNTINGFYLSAHCYISPDESFILFDAQSSSGGNIYYSKRNQNGSWGNAIKLDTYINSTSNQYLSYLSPDQKYLFYAAQGDIYWCEWKNHNPLKIEDKTGTVIKDFNLHQNYPNPFNPATNIQYSVASKQHVSLKVYDLLGNEIATLVNEEKSIGNYEIEFNGSSLSTGIYYYRLNSGNINITKKMLLIN